MAEWNDTMIAEKHACSFCKESFRTNFQLQRHNGTHRVWEKAAKYVDSNFAEQEKIARYYDDQEEI